MLRVRIVSDAHLEQHVHSTVPLELKWDRFTVPAKEFDSESVLIIAGDFVEFEYIEFYAECFRALAQRFIAVVYVPGNHEYYGTAYGRTNFFHYKELLRSYGKIHLLDNSSIVIDGTKIYGTTLWSAYDHNPLTASLCSGINDFKYAKTVDSETNEDRVTRVDDYIERHDYAVEKLMAELSRTNEPLIVVSHFAPSRQSIHDRYKDATPTELNSHFCNNLDQLILDNEQIKLWIHGHTHTEFDYMIGQTRIMCNPKGYKGEGANSGTSPDYVEVS